MKIMSMIVALALFGSATMFGAGVLIDRALQSRHMRTTLNGPAIYNKAEEEEDDFDRRFGRWEAIGDDARRPVIATPSWIESVR